MKNLRNYKKQSVEEILKKEDISISQYAECLSKAFKGYSLFEYFSRNNYDEVKMNIFWQTMIKASKENSLMMSSGKNAESVIVCFKPGYNGPGIVSYLKNGGFKIIKNFGILSVIDMMKFEEFADEIKQKYVDGDCWYLYSFATNPEFQGKGHGSKLLKELLNFFDENKQNCYLETLKEENVGIYKHFGFDLVEVKQVPKTDLTIYAMYREHKKELIKDQEIEK